MPARLGCFAVDSGGQTQTSAVTSTENAKLINSTPKYSGSTVCWARGDIYRNYIVVECCVI